MTPGIRPAVRALVLDNDDHVLMVRLDFPNGTWWVLPGGGIEPGEDETAALHRELDEEVGLRGAEIGGHVWRRTHLFPMTDPQGRSWSGQSENVYLVRTSRFVPAPALGVHQLHEENLTDHRWWSLTDVESHSVDGEHIAPLGFAAILRSVIENGAPAEPFDLFQED